ncbi:hypothetical protein [uncultured Nocardioides sp.]|uniref:hypothetical protein n=1 Tax=uncultured Nocardioides sp. TaxID=198441 RepID=UPI00262D4B7A|nr:hypothetical protein [uncultured Nocardioides sp.]
MTDDLKIETPAEGMSRRSVVKTGANLAWAVPAVTVATAAPAMAVSPPPPDPVEPPPADEQNTDAEPKAGGKKAKANVDMGTASEPLAPGDLIVVVKSKGAITGGGPNWDRNPAAGRSRDEYAFVLSTAVAAGAPVPNFTPNVKRINKRKGLPKRSRYFVTNTATGEVIWTGVIYA